MKRIWLISPIVLMGLVAGCGTPSATTSVPHTPQPGASTTSAPGGVSGSGGALVIAKGFVIAVGSFNYKTPTANQKLAESYATSKFATELANLYKTAYASLVSGDVKNGTVLNMGIKSVTVKTLTVTTATVVVVGSTSGTSETTPGNPATEKPVSGNNSTTYTVDLVLVSGHWLVNDFSTNSSAGG